MAARSWSEREGIAQHRRVGGRDQVEQPRMEFGRNLGDLEEHRQDDTAHTVGDRF